MATITDNTGTQSFEEVAGLLWVKSVYPSYTNYRSDDWFVGQTPKGNWLLQIVGQTHAQVFATARAAQRAAGLAGEQEVAA